MRIYELRTKEGTLKANISHRLALELFADCDGYWKDFKYINDNTQRRKYVIRKGMRFTDRDCAIYLWDDDYITECI